MKTVFSPLHAGHARPDGADRRRHRAGLRKAVARRDHQGARRVERSSARSWRRRSTTWPPPSACTRPTTSTSCRRSGRCGRQPADRARQCRFAWPTRGLRGDVRPEAIDALLGFYSFDAGASFVAGTWAAIKSSYDVALTAAALVSDGEAAAFALCRPPGHHAGAAFMGGYCYINNAAVAAQWFRDQGAAQGRHPRRRLSSRQRHPGDLLRARRRAGRQSACRSDDRVSVLPRPCRRARRRRRRRLQPQLSRCRSAPAGARWSAALEDGLRRSRRLTHPTWWWSRSASTRSRRTRSASSS